VDSQQLLIVEDDHDLLTKLAVTARARHYATQTASTLAGARRALRGASFDLAVVDLVLGRDSGFEAIRAIKKRSADTEIVVISQSTALVSAIAAYDLKAFAFVPKPFDIDHLFRTVERALEHRGVMLANRRLVWEQRLVNEVGDELRHLLAPEQLVQRVLGRLMRGLDIDASGARLLNPQTGAYDLRVVDAPADIRRLWDAATPIAPRPSVLVLATRSPIRIDDVHAGLDAAAAAQTPVRSALSVPMFAG